MRHVFRALRTRNYRLFFSGQVVSLIGTWMQIVANSWLVLKLSSSGLAVGIATALQFGPMLVGGAWGGLIADRFPKRRMLLVTQTLFLVQALTLGTLTAGGWARLWMVYGLTFLYGCVQVIDVPTRQAFVSEMVDKDDVMNAVGLNSALFNAARMVGPAVAGLIIAKASISICYFANSASFLTVLVALALMRQRDLNASPARPPSGRGQIRAGFRYVAAHPDLLLSIVLMAIVGTLSLNFQIIMPLLARFTFKGDASTYGTLSSVMAFGSVAGAMYAAARHRSSPQLLVGAAVALGVVETAAAMVPSLFGAYLVLPFVGLAGMLFISASNSLLQLKTSPEMRGRVLALWSLVFLGSTPIGGPLVGWISQTWSPRYGLGIGGVASLVAGLVVGPILLRRKEAEPVTPARIDTELEPIEPETVAAGETS
jgi:MFS family permease